nr:hypothetical protein [Escherichia coli]
MGGAIRDVVKKYVLSLCAKCHDIVDITDK